MFKIKNLSLFSFSQELFLASLFIISSTLLIGLPEVVVNLAFAEEQDEPRLGRLPDGRAYRIDQDGNQLVDYIAELELERDTLNTQVNALKNDVDAKVKYIEEKSAGSDINKSSTNKNSSIKEINLKNEIDSSDSKEIKVQSIKLSDDSQNDSFKTNEKSNDITKEELENLKAKTDEQNSKIAKLQNDLLTKNQELREALNKQALENRLNESTNNKLLTYEQEVANKEKKLNELHTKLETLERERLEAKESSDTKSAEKQLALELERLKKELHQKYTELAQRENDIKQKADLLKEREETLAKKDQEIAKVVAPSPMIPSVVAEDEMRASLQFDEVPAQEKQEEINFNKPDSSRLTKVVTKQRDSKNIEFVNTEAFESLRKKVRTEYSMLISLVSTRDQLARKYNAKSQSGRGVVLTIKPKELVTNDGETLDSVQDRLETAYTVRDLSLISEDINKLKFMTEEDVSLFR